ncbi:MAG: transcription antitermination factor NusB [Elusimicrobia bacterium]|nr:transcription antitermination factor NusB [Elusimicrobiota bacterium]
MGSRRQAREICLQCLYLWDNCQIPAEEAWQTAVTEVNFNHDRDNVYGQKNAKAAKPKNDPLTIEFAQKLFQGIVKDSQNIDALIQTHCHNWKLSRMSAIDRNIIRLGAFEIIAMPETPINVIINEAVEIAKSYSTDDSGKFVNGILDKLKEERKA